MDIQQIRNATLVVTYANQVLLIDPFLGEKAVYLLSVKRRMPSPIHSSTYRSMLRHCSILTLSSSRICTRIISMMLQNNFYPSICHSMRSKKKTHGKSEKPASRTSLPSIPV